MTTFSARPGFALPVVLIIALLGILLGFGRLLVFHNQCRLRLDRQQEYEKIFAVRSAMNRLQNGTPKQLSLPEEGEPDELIALHTDSGREIKVLIHPADPVFPILDVPGHFCIGRDTANIDHFTRIDQTNYKYGSSVNGDSALRRVLGADPYVCLMPTNAAPGDMCRLSLDMSETGRWCDDSYGRRYAFNVYSFCGTNAHDLVRFILRRKRSGEIFDGSAVHLDKADESWRPQQNHESVIYAELQTAEFGPGAFTAWTQRYGEKEIPCVSCVVTNSDFNAAMPNRNGFGIQLVGRNLTLFQASPPTSKLFKKHNFVGSGQIPEGVYIDFTNDVNVAVGMGTTLSTNMVMEIEVVANPSRDPALGVIGQNNFNRFEVFPAFEFAINIENENERLVSDVATKPRQATVVHLDIDAGRSTECTAITYDTHGTEISGWRTDERKAWRLLK